MLIVELVKGHSPVLDGSRATAGIFSISPGSNSKAKASVGTHYCLAVGNDEGLELDETDEDEELCESDEEEIEEDEG